MQNTQILSTQPPLPDSGPPERSARSVRAAAGAGPGGQPPRGRALVFDACQVGVVLRAVLFVELVVGVGAMYGAGNPVEWLATLALLTGGALPATLLWLVTACSLKTVLQRLTTVQQYLAGVLLGALAGAYACGMLALVAQPTSAPWLASAATGALLAAMLVAALVLRARGRTPAATTARLTELQSRIRPHFLFNTLNTAIALVQVDPPRAERVLEDLAELFRQALAAPQGRSTLADEIALSRRYLDIEQLRFGERLQVRWQLDPAADATVLPPLILQPLVENAVRHGVEPSAEGGWVSVQTQAQAGHLVLTVRNSVPQQGALPFAPGHGMALRNVRQRLQLMHDVQLGFSAGLKPAATSGESALYEVRVRVPLPEKASA